MAGEASSVQMPVLAGQTDPASVVVARVIRAGLIRRSDEAIARFGKLIGATGGRHLDRNEFEFGVPPTALQPPALAEFFQRRWPLVRRYTSTDRFRAESLLSVLWRVREVDGDVVECGSFRCGLGFLFAFAIKEWGLSKKVHLYDSFEGLPPLTDEDKAHSEETFFFAGQFQKGVILDRVRAFLDEHDLNDVVELHQGWFDQTLPQLPTEQRFCFAHLDCDLYKSAQTCFTYLVPQASPGAGFVIDDYDSHGMYQATWEFLEQPHMAYPVSTGALKQAYFFTTPGLHSSGRSEDWSPLLANRPYCAYLASICGEMILACSGPSNGPHDDTMKASLDRILGSEDKVAFLERFIKYLYQDA